MTSRSANAFRHFTFTSGQHERVTDAAQFFNAFIDVVGLPGNTKLDRRVLFLVPPKVIAGTISKQTGVPVVEKAVFSCVYVGPPNEYAPGLFGSSPSS